jgi:hypothetical protein
MTGFSEIRDAILANRKSAEPVHPYSKGGHLFDAATQSPGQEWTRPDVLRMLAQTLPEIFHHVEYGDPFWAALEADPTLAVEMVKGNPFTFAFLPGSLRSNDAVQAQWLGSDPICPDPMDLDGMLLHPYTEWRNPYYAELRAFHAGEQETEWHWQGPLTIADWYHSERIHQRVEGVLAEFETDWDLGSDRIRAYASIYRDILVKEGVRGIDWQGITDWSIGFPSLMGDARFWSASQNILELQELGVTDWILNPYRVGSHQILGWFTIFQDLTPEMQLRVIGFLHELYRVHALSFEDPAVRYAAIGAIWKELAALHLRFAMESDPVSEYATAPSRLLFE